jgi:glycosyltransferase involved in cell wall biosynthesis
LIVKPETYKHLIAVKNNKIIKIPNMVLRKIVPIDKQNANLTKNSICIVCNFRFLENKPEWSKKIKAVGHPFRDDSIFPNTINKYLFSESDFCDKLTTCVDNRMSQWNNQGYDFVYFTLISREGTRSKGLYLLSLINEVAEDLNLRGLIVNYSTRETAKHKGTIYHKSLKKIKKEINTFQNLQIINKNYSSKEVCAIMKSVKFVLIPSDADASPRLIVESLVRDRPLVVNSVIYGGWKYINDKTGSFFEAPNVEECYKEKYSKDYNYYKSSLSKSIRKTLSIKRDACISDNFYEEYGFLNSSKRLANIINKISGTNYKAVAFREWGNSLKKAYKI